jgi:hypothetical protein
MQTEVFCIAVLLMFSIYSVTLILSLCHQFSVYITCDVSLYMLDHSIRGPSPLPYHPGFMVGLVMWVV